jgi:hypothetical protein
MKVRRICPSTDGEQEFEMSGRPLHEVELFEVTVEVVLRLVPRITWVVNIRVGPFVGEDDFAFGVDVGEGVKDVAGRWSEQAREVKIWHQRQIIDWDGHWWVLSAIDPPGLVG